MVDRQPRGHLAALPCAPEMLDRAAGEDLSGRFVAAMRVDQRLQAWTPRLSLVPHGGAWHQHLTLQHADGVITWQQTVQASTCTVERLIIEPAALRRQGLGKVLLRHALAWYDHYGIELLRLHAAKEDGGYWWARRGFVPDDEDWRRLRQQIEYYLECWKTAPGHSQISPAPPMVAICCEVQPGMVRWT